LRADSTTGGSQIFSNSFYFPNTDTTAPRVRISPDGTLIAISTNPLSAGNPGTNILRNGSLVTALSGFPVGWIDNGHLLVDTYSIPEGVPVYTGCGVYDGSGRSAGTCGLPEVTEFQPLTSSDSIYAVNRASIISVSTGSVLWMSADPASLSTSAVAGNRVVFISGTRVLAQGY